MWSHSVTDCTGCHQHWDLSHNLSCTRHSKPLLHQTLKTSPTPDTQNSAAGVVPVQISIFFPYMDTLVWNRFSGIFSQISSTFKYFVFLSSDCVRWKNGKLTETIDNCSFYRTLRNSSSGFYIHAQLRLIWPPLGQRPGKILNWQRKFKGFLAFGQGVVILFFSFFYLDGAHSFVALFGANLISD